MTDKRTGEIAEYSKIVEYGDFNRKNENNDIIKFSDFINIFKKYFVAILIISSIITVMISGFIKITEKPTYSYSGMLHILPGLNESGLDIDAVNLRFLMYGDSLKNIALLTNEEFIAIKALNNAKIDLSFIKKWDKNVTIELLPNSGLLEIMVKSEDDNKSKMLVNSLIDVIKNNIETTYPDNIVNINAPAAMSYSGNNSSRVGISFIIIIFAFSMMMAYMLFVVRCFFSNKINTKADIAKVTPYPLLVKSVRGKEKETAFLTDSIISTIMGHPDKKIMLWLDFQKNIQSSQIVNSTAKLLGSRNQKILLIDTDLKNKLLSKSYKLESNEGVCDFLTGSMDKAGAGKLVFKSNLGIDIISIGSGIDKSLFIQKIDGIRTLIDMFREDYDQIHLSTSPIENFPECMVVSNFTDATILLINQNSVTAGKLEDACEILTHLDSNIKGIVMTNVFLG